MDGKKEEIHPAICFSRGRIDWNGSCRMPRFLPGHDTLFQSVKNRFGYCFVNGLAHCETSQEVGAR